MIDSVLLKIPVSSNQISPLLTRKKTNSSKGNIRVITLSEEINSSHKKKGIYKPLIYLETQNRITEQKYICLQISLPKLLFGNSLLEVNQNHFNRIIEEIYILLTNYEIYIPKQKILDAWVCRIDYSKIIILPKNYTNARDFIEKLEKGAFRSRSDLTKRDVRNGKEGYWIKFYNSTSSVTFYDKMSEIANQGYTTSEKELTKFLQENKLSRNILKYEVALQKTQKVSTTLNKVLNRKQSRYSFKEIFSEEISKVVLLHFLNASFNNEVDFLCTCFNEQEIRTQIRNLFGYKKNKTYIYFILREIEARGAKIVFEEIKTIHGYSYKKSIQKDLEQLSIKLTEANKQKISPISYLKDYLTKFQLHSPTSS